jgi:hypothetical protein
MQPINSDLQFLTVMWIMDIQAKKITIITMVIFLTLPDLQSVGNQGSGVLTCTIQLKQTWAANAMSFRTTLDNGN